METVAKRLYEGMFLVDSALAAADWDDTVGVIENILKRADAEIVALRKWGERRLAFEIAHKSRGTYILTYFKADPQRIAGVEKDVQLSEKVMRVLVLGTEKRPAEVLEADITGVTKEAEPEATDKAKGAVTPGESSPAPKPAPEAQAAAAEKPTAADASVPKATAEPAAPETAATAPAPETSQSPDADSIPETVSDAASDSPDESVKA